MFDWQLPNVRRTFRIVVHWIIDRMKPPGTAEPQSDTLKEALIKVQPDTPGSQSEGLITEPGAKRLHVHSQGVEEFCVACWECTCSRFAPGSALTLRDPLMLNTKN